MHILLARSAQRGQRSHYRLFAPCFCYGQFVNSVMGLLDYDREEISRNTLDDVFQNFCGVLRKEDDESAVSYSKIKTTALCKSNNRVDVKPEILQELEARVTRWKNCKRTWTISSLPTPSWKTNLPPHPKGTNHCSFPFQILE